MNHPEVATARDLVDLCDYFLAALDAHWQVIVAYLPDGHAVKSEYANLSSDSAHVGRPPVPV